MELTAKQRKAITDANYYRKNKKFCDAKNRQYVIDNSEKVRAFQKEYYLANREKLIARSNASRIKNRARLRKLALARKRERNKTDISYRLKENLRHRLFLALKGQTKGAKLAEYLGCSIDSLKSHLAAKFQEGMSWENYGKWHVDHIKPLSLYDLTDRMQLLEAGHFSNLQPLWAIDNIRKNAKYSP